MILNFVVIVVIALVVEYFLFVVFVVELIDLVMVVELIGFVKMGDLGCSPDGLVGLEGIIEIKCSEGPSHYRIVIKKKMPTSHIPQVQGNLWITDRKWCDFISYDPWGKYNPFYCVRSQLT